MNNRTDLSLIPIEDLVEEVTSRCDHIAVIGYQDYRGRRPDQVLKSWKGGTFNVIGMLDLMKYDILTWYNSDSPSGQEI